MPNGISRVPDLVGACMAAIVAVVAALSVLVSGAQGVDLLLGTDGAAAAGVRCGAPARAAAC